MTPKVRFRILAIAVFLLGLAAMLGAANWDSGPYAQRILVITGAGVLIAASALLFLTTFAQSSAALLRLDWFLPFLRKKKKNAELAPDGAAIKLAKRILPARLFADRVTGKPGLFRRFLKKIGPSVLSSPFRRIVQGICLLLFLLLFFHVCWPYSARPAEPGNVSIGWRFDEIDQASGNLKFTIATEPAWSIDSADAVHLAESASQQDSTTYLGEFEVATWTGRSLSLKPKDDLTPDQFDRFLTSSGSWEIHEKEPNRWPSHYADSLKEKELLPAESFLAIDPLVGISTSIAARSWVWSLACAGAILMVCVVIPRGFCGYVCPLGTVIDLFDWLIGRRVKKFQVPGEGWWVHIKYYLLTGILVCALFGVLISGVFAAIPIITRAALFIGEPLQSGMMRRWDLVPAINAGHVISISLFIAILSLGFLRPRFWCKYVCPSGAVFSLGNLFRVTERKVESSCINCNKCVEICPFDAIKPDFTTRETDCTMCQTCGGVCPTQAIKFVDRWNVVELKVENDPPTHETAIGRRGFLSLAAGTAAAVVGGVGTALVTSASGARLESSPENLPVRPPGSVPEQEFLQMCIRCGECFKACPNNVLQAEGFQQGFEGLWAPLVNADWAGCESSCNACGQVCPTGAIRELPLAEKKVVRMGLAIVNQETCLPFAGKEDCDLCVVECNAAGYHAIEYQQVHTEVDDDGNPLEDSGFLAPVVLADKCVGCGLCQTRCNVINVKDRHVLQESAIIIEAGEDKEDRIMSGSYIALRREEETRREQEARRQSGQSRIREPAPEPKKSLSRKDDSNPFGIEQTQPSNDKKDPPTKPKADDDPFGLGNGGL